MRVLLINQVFHPDPQATGQYLSPLAEALVQQGHQVTVLTGRRSYENPSVLYPARETWRGVEIIRVSNAGFGRGTKWGLALKFLSFYLSVTLRALFLPRADVVMTLTTPPLVSVLGGMLALLWRARFVYWVMDLNPDEAVAVGWLSPDSPLTHLLEAASRWSLHRADRVIVLDDYMRDRLAAKGIAPEKIETVPIWMHHDVTFDPAGRQRFRQEQGWADKHVVMYSGNHTACHPLDTLYEAAKLLRDDPRIHFCFSGGGGEWGKLKARAQTDHLPNVTFLGYQPFEKLSGALSAADTQVVVMGDAFVGIIHPCKVYNFLAVQRPFIYIGPKRSHVADLILEAGLQQVGASFAHGESRAMAGELQRRATGKNPLPWPNEAHFQKWSESSVLEKLISALTLPQ